MLQRPFITDNESLLPAITKVVNPLPPPTTIFDLPETRNDRFVGREDALEKIRSLLEEAKKKSAGRRIAIMGLGGMGKTQVALEYCYRNRDDYLYIFWVLSESDTSIQSG